MNELEALQDRVAAMEQVEAELRQRTRALEQERHRLRAIVDHAREGIVTSGPDGSILYANRAAAKILGRASPDELVGQPAAGLYQAQEAREQIIEQLKEQGHFDDLEVTLTQPSGAPVHLLASAFLHRDSQGAYVENVGYMSDVTRRRRVEEELRVARDQLDSEVRQRTAELAEANERLVQESHRIRSSASALRQSEGRFRMVLEDAPVTVFQHDLDLRYTWVYNRHPDISDDSILGRLDTDLFAPAEAARLTELKRQVVKTGQGVREGLGITIDGRPHFYDFTIEPLLDDDEQLVGLTGVMMDITERKESERTLREYAQKQQEMVQQLEEAQDRLLRQERLAVLGRLGGGVAHELRNPMGVISNAVYFLKMTQTAADETTRKYLEIIARSVRSAEKIVADLLNLTSTRPMEREEAAVADLVAGALEALPLPDDVELITDLPRDLPPLHVDPQNVGQILLNLISNAFQAMPHGGALTIASRATEDRVQIRVSDMGCGIPQQDQEKVFEPLFSTKPRGIGLGLSVCRHLATINGGSLEVESDEGQGSTFTLSLPLEVRS